MKKAFFNWSTGKDSALALNTLLNDTNFTVGILVTKFNKKFKGVFMQGVPEVLLENRLKALAYR